ncbi:MAG TPA: C40 family peptidase [Paludibacter sp.]|nr:C40 family peptidase [Paludibacter sp.]
MHGIIIHPLVSVLKSNDERSELTTQLLFGETVRITEVLEKWVFVENLIDNYLGWVDRKNLRPISKPIQNDNYNKIIVPVSACKIVDSSEIIYLPAGSILQNYENGKFVNFDIEYQINPEHVQCCNTVRYEKITSVAKQFLNAPYLWGGKNILGIDCSGLVQVVFSLCGIELPRDAGEQLEKGMVIDSINDTAAGDLVYFDNDEGSVIHVGIMLNNKQIIHASGWVKIEDIDNYGIISSQTGEYSHRICKIKRLIYNV